MENISELLSELNRSDMESETKEYLKRAIVAYSDGKGAAAMDAILDDFVDGDDS